MTKHVLVMFLAILVLTGCGESKEDAEERKAKEFWTIPNDNSGSRAKREKLYDECYDRNVRNIMEIQAEAKKISGNNNVASDDYQEIYQKLKRERDAEVSKCLQIRRGD